MIQQTSVAPPSAASTDFSIVGTLAVVDFHVDLARGLGHTDSNVHEPERTASRQLTDPAVIGLVHEVSVAQTGRSPNGASEGDVDGGAEGVAVGLGGRGDDVERVGRRVEHAEHAAHHAAVDGAEHRVLDRDVAERAVIADDPQAVDAAASGHEVGLARAGREAMGREGGGDRLHRRAQRPLPAASASPVSPAASVRP